MRTSSRGRLVLLGLGTIAAAAALGQAPAPAPAPAAELPPPATILRLRTYIKEAWTTLARSNRDLPAAAVDPKLHLPPGRPYPVYLAPTEDKGRVERELRQALGPGGLGKIELRTLPKDVGRLKEHGLLYLPRPYVVPGGRFNEMYGWDSYFIQVGLLLDGEVDRARDLAMNFVYEVENYGTILNANRTYYLTRSQPPFLTRMVLGVFRKTGDKAWLRSTLPAIEAYYRFWTTEPHLVPELGLSRYYDRGEGPAPEALSDERDERGRTHYDRAREYYKSHEVTDYDVALYYDRARDRLTDLFYKGDRSQRESGFDPSNRFGPLNADIIHYAPVCLNSLLVQMEDDGVEVARTLGDAKAEAQWEFRAARRRAAVNRHCWDPEAGLYFDYSFRALRRRRYVFATTFYPLWAGIASKAQAARVVSNLPLLEAPGGLLTSAQETGNQWDAPFGWGPLQMIAVSGLRRYGYHDHADRLAKKFVSLVAKELEEHGAIVEKYDLVRRESDVSAGIRFGYSSNEVGFGWTNAAVLDLLAGLEEARRPAAAR
jgi:alpha,alpha-trehalase